MIFRWDIIFRFVEHDASLTPGSCGNANLVVNCRQLSGPWFNIKMSPYKYRKSHCGDKTVVRSSYLHNGISYSGKMSSLYWISPLVSVVSWNICVIGEKRKFGMANAQAICISRLDWKCLNSARIFSTENVGWNSTEICSCWSSWR